MSDEIILIVGLHDENGIDVNIFTANIKYCVAMQ